MEPTMFGMMDEARRQAGLWLDVAGLGKDELPFRIAAVMRGARLRAYQEPAGRGSPLLIVTAPFKRPYIWDLMPQISVIRRCIAHGLRVYLVEWTPPTVEDDDLGLDDFALGVIGEATEVIEAETGQARTTIAGHSLGGTFA